MNKSLFETQKSASLSHQLVKLGRLLNKKGLAKVQGTLGLPNLRQAHLDLFPYIDFKGTSVSEIANRKGVSKQSVSKLVQEMVQMKFLSLKANPEDSRSKLVLIKTSGPFAIENGFEALKHLDEEIVEILGKKKYRSALEETSDIMKIFESDNTK